MSREIHHDTAQLLVEAAPLALRMPLTRAAETLGVGIRKLYKAIERHPEQWQAELDAARAERKAAGQPVDERDPSDETRQRMRDAARLIAAGHTRIEAAEQLGFAPGTIDTFKRRHPQHWQAELDNARQALVAMVEAEGGTADDLRTGPPADVRQKIGEVARLLAAGYTRPEVAQQLGTTKGQLDHWQDRYRPAWDAAVDQAMQVSREMLRRIAGTDRVFDDPGAYVRQIENCDRWAKSRGETLIDTEDLTLTRFYATYFAPMRLTDVTQKHRDGFERALRIWTLATGDPPLEKITGETMAVFLEFLKALPGQATGSTMAPNTVRKNLQHVQWVLDKAGPATRGNRDGAGILDTVPWIKPPRATKREPRIIEPEEVNKLYEAAATMDRPEVHGAEPAEVWRALMAIAWNTGLRAGSIFALRWEHIDMAQRLIDLPPEVMKSRRRHRVPVNRTAFTHLERIQADAGPVFPWNPGSLRFYKAWEMLLRRAGIPEQRRFALQNFRQTAATQLVAIDPELARATLGHVSLGTTFGHYVDRDRIAAKMLDRIEQPAAFAKGGAT